MEVSGQLHALVTLSPGKEPPVPNGEEGRQAPEPIWMWWPTEKNPCLY